MVAWAEGQRRIRFSNIGIAVPASALRQFLSQGGTLQRRWSQRPAQQQSCEHWLRQGSPAVPAPACRQAGAPSDCHQRPALSADSVDLGRHFASPARSAGSRQAGGTEDRARTEPQRMAGGINVGHPRTDQTFMQIMRVQLGRTEDGRGLLPSTPMYLRRHREEGQGRDTYRSFQTKVLKGPASCSNQPENQPEGRYVNMVSGGRTRYHEVGRRGTALSTSPAQGGMPAPTVTGGRPGHQLSRL